VKDCPEPMADNANQLNKRVGRRFPFANKILTFRDGINNVLIGGSFCNFTWYFSISNVSGINTGSIVIRLQEKEGMFVVFYKQIL